MKNKTLLVILFALVISLMIAIPTFAASSANGGEPKYYDGTVDVLAKGKEYFFANGVEITIEAPTSGEGAIIKWEGGSQQVGKEAYIFGGMHDDNTGVTTKITMNGGTVRQVYGGGLHTSKTVKSQVIINNGTVLAVYGGGAASLNFDCGCTEYKDAKNPKNSNCQTENANVTINGGTITHSVWGGGNGISNTDKANVTITSGNFKNAWVTAGGSNGSTGVVSLIITGGELGIVQSVNRGTVDEATVVVAGGTIESLYAGGESPESVPGDVVNAYITKKLQVGVAGVAKVKNMYLGSNGDKDLVISDATGSVFTSEDIIVVPSTVEKLNGIDKTQITVAHQIIIDGQLYMVKDGQTLKDLPEYETIIKKDGYTFKGFKNGDANFDIDTKINDNYELTTVFEKVENNSAEDNKDEVKDEAKDEAKDEVPKTGVESTEITVFTVVAIISLLALAVVKKDRK